MAEKPIVQSTECCHIVVHKEYEEKLKELSENKKWVDDLDIAVSRFPEFEELAGRSVLITGATGLVCSAIADMLIRCNENMNIGIEIYVTGRNPEKVKERFGEYASKEYFHILRYDALEEIRDFPEKIDFIIHGAGNAFPAAIVKEPVETMECNIGGTIRLLKYGNTAGCKRFMYISSSEVYGKKKTASSFNEEDYGYVDLLNPRSSYPISKRAGETLCISYSEEYGMDCVIIRPGHIYGPTCSRTDNRVSSAFAYLAAEGKDIVLKSSGSQIRSYVYCVDCASAALIALIKGENRQAYNISNPGSVISIREMADILAEAGNVQVKMELPDENEIKAFNPMDNSSLDSSKLLDLGWRGMFDAKTGLTNTVRILHELN